MNASCDRSIWYLQLAVAVQTRGFLLAGSRVIIVLPGHRTFILFVPGNRHIHLKHVFEERRGRLRHHARAYKECERRASLGVDRFRSASGII